MSASLLNATSVRILVKQQARVPTEAYLTRLNAAVRQVICEHCHRTSRGRRLDPLLFELRGIRKGNAR